MKDYLNGEERQQALYLYISHSLVSGILEVNKKNMSKKEITALKYIITYLEKYLDALTERVGLKELQRINRDSQDYTIVTKPKNYDGYYTIDKNGLEEIARYAVEKRCFGCSREDWHECELYRYMKKAGMGRVDEIPGKCEFFYHIEKKRIRLKGILK